MVGRKVLVATLIAFALSGSALAQDLSKLITKAEVEKVTGAKFKDGWKPMEGQIMFQQEGGDLQISVEVEKRDAGASVRTASSVPGTARWAAAMTGSLDSGADVERNASERWRASNCRSRSCSISIW